MLYRTEREGGGYTVSSVRPPKGTRYKVRWRLVADEGRAITDGENVVTVIDLQHRKDCEGWRDCEKPEEPDPAAIAAVVPFPAGPEAGQEEDRDLEETGEGEAYDD